MRAAIYARVSTSNNGQSPEMQLRELREYCQRREWDIAIAGDKEAGHLGGFFSACLARMALARASSFAASASLFVFRSSLA